MRNIEFIVESLLEGNSSGLIRALKDLFDHYRTGSFLANWHQILSVPESQWYLTGDDEVRELISLADRTKFALKTFLRVVGPMVVHVPAESFEVFTSPIEEGASAGALVRALDDLDQTLQHPTAQRTFSRVDGIPASAWGHLSDGDIARATKATVDLGAAFRNYVAKGVPIARRALQAKPKLDLPGYDSAAHSGSSKGAPVYGRGVTDEPEANWGKGGWNR